MTISDFALDMLGRYVAGADLTAPAAPIPSITDAGYVDTTEIRTAWVEWLAANASTLIFDDEAGTWSAP